DAQKQNYTWLENLVKEFLQTNNKQSIDNKKKVCEQRKDVLKVIQDIINELVESILKIESANDQVSSNKMVATFIGLYALFLCTNFCFLNAVERSNIKIQCRGNYVPVEIDVQANAANEQTLELVIESQNEKENKKFHFIRSQILKDLNTFESHDEPINDSDSHQISSFTVSCIYVENIVDIQAHSLRILTELFSRYEHHPDSILEDILLIYLEVSQIVIVMRKVLRK
ncbi:unnamed protein product, partial [Rotaria sp. Silwood1]